jgi:hypothetical protein
MRTRPILLLAVGLTLAACDETSSPTRDGTLVVSTSTGGNDPDQDGYLLTVDGVDSLVLVPTGTAELDLAAGQHTLELLGMAEHCLVAPANPLDVDVPPHGTTPVTFEISCNLTGARITTATTGLDFDPDGYRVAVDGTDLGRITANTTVLTQLDPGSRTIALTGLTQNCTIEGPGSRTVTIVAAEVLPIEFAVVCTATSGVIGVVISGSGVGGVYDALVDGATPLRVGPGDRAYLRAVPAGDHVVSLSGPANCSVETDPQSVTVTAGSLIRDTVEVTFSVTCVTGVLVTTPTTGTIPRDDWTVWLCYDSYSCHYHFLARRLGSLAPNDTLIAEVDPGTYWFYLDDLINCQVIVPDPRNGHNPRRDITILPGRLVTVSFPVVCS